MVAILTLYVVLESALFHAKQKHNLFISEKAWVLLSCLPHIYSEFNQYQRAHALCVCTGSKMFHLKEIAPHLLLSAVEPCNMALSFVFQG